MKVCTISRNANSRRHPGDRNGGRECNQEEGQERREAGEQHDQRCPLLEHLPHPGSLFAPRLAE
jgi:hypothetical protein